MPTRIITRLIRLGCLTTLPLLASGCGSATPPLVTSTVTTTSSSTPTIDPTPQTSDGYVHGGLQTITGAHIYVYAAGSSGYGGSSVSLINPGHPGVSTDSFGSYVTTNSSGGFSLSGTYNCYPGQQVYVLARGGNPGLPSGATNSAITLMTVLGSCPNNGSFAGIIPSINLTEVSTVAAVYALGGFMTDATHISAAASDLSQQGLANAFRAFTNLASVSSGYTVPLSVYYNGVIPAATINTLANILVACVNTDGISGPCPTLFANAKDPSGNLPTDTASAAVNIAHNPGANVAALYALSGPAPPFQPILTAVPNDWTVAITFYTETMAGPYYPAIDASGNLWVPGYANNTLTEFDPLGVPLSGFSAFSGNNLNQPFYVAIDSGQSAWVANYAYGATAVVSRFSSNGLANGNFPCGTNCTAVALDSLQNVWVAANSGISVMHNSGISISQVTAASYAPGLAIDSVGRGWSVALGRNLDRLTLPGTLAPFSEAVSSTQSGDLNQVAIDSADNIWFTSGKNNALGRYDSKGNLISPATGYTGGGLKFPAQLAIDGSDRVWVANRDGNSISAFTNAGVPISPATGYTPSGQVAPDPSVDPIIVGVRSPHGLAIDGSGNIWVTNFTANSVTEFLGLATPGVPPISPSTHGRRP